MELVDIKGIGDNTLKILNKLNINNIEELITYYPFRYNIIKRSDIQNISDSDTLVIDGILESIPNVFFYGKKRDKMTFKFNCGTKNFNIIIFNRGFLKNRLSIGDSITIVGKYETKNNTIIASELRMGSLSNTPSIEPIYHTCSGISVKQINSIIKNALMNDAIVDDYIPDYLNQKYKFLSKNECIRIIHNPINLEILKKARTKLKYEELFLFMLKINHLKNKKHKLGLEKKIDYSNVEELISKLPFTLTEDQNKSVIDIYNDMTNKNQMNRLLQGDVGSGKTIVSFIALYMNYLAKYQGCLMAPTEILAIQHYENIKKILDINICLLTGKTKSSEKKKILKELKEGKIDIVIGTHALISNDVIYKNLGLVITDEQHRFGVNQRANLKNKGTTPDILYMSATPIPRTYALTIYGDMEISNIKTMPSGRKEVKTLLKKDKEIKEVLTMMYNELKKGHQIYVIAPLIENTDNSEMENIYELETKMNKAFGKLYNIGILHGKMSNKEKDNVMNEFKENKINILVSTTVIEVGIDVKNATMIVIFDSYRFGLSALHQLRGRVGRSNLDSYCILISTKETERLKVLTHTNDGFKISEEDFKLRGSGDIFGIKQSGDMNFQLANIKNDYNILLKTKEDSKYFLEHYINDNKYEHIKKLLSESINLD
ncbi:MAG: ATP-dependent DNA helicase RecG [Bacilli bacterium]|nr:ATP-dependent DNA helicase RecG [Bacilli bacterium]